MSDAKDQPKEQQPKWVLRWGHHLSPTPLRPGVWRCKEGGYLIRARVKDQRRGKLMEVKRHLREAKNAAEAAAELARLLAELRGSRGSAPARIRWHAYVAQWVERKVASGDLASPQAAMVLASDVQHLMGKELADLYMDSLRPADLLAWRDKVAEQVASGRYSPRTCNNWLKRIRQICRDAVTELELPRDPSAVLKAFPTGENRTYTREQPNSLRPADLGVFCAAVREVEPHYWALVVLAFATGLRPSSLRPLRHRGPNSDVLWSEGLLLIRRSYVRTRILERTKTGVDLQFDLPAELLEVLRQHAATLPEAQELLFPGLRGGLMATNVLGKLFARVQRKLGWEGRWLTPRAMRRTFNDSTRAAAVRDLVTRSISGHQTPAEQVRYSTVQPEEQKAAITAAMAPILTPGGASGASGGARDTTPDTKQRTNTPVGIIAAG